MIQNPSLETTDPYQVQSVALEALGNLLQSLHHKGIRYCHWKSNVRLKESLSAQTDLDLLVDRQDSRAFRQTLYEHQVKPVLAPLGKRYPGLEDYLGFDPASGKLFHLHVHYQLVLGEQFVKNYHLPLERHVLDSSQWRHGVKIPSPELEIVILSLRALLKYRGRDVVKDLLTIRSPGVPAEINHEIKWLLEQTSLERISQTLVEIDDLVPADVVLEFLATVVSAPRDGYRLYRLRKRTRQALSPYQRHRRSKAKLIYFKELWRRRNSFLKFSPSRKMTPVNGGMTLALVGADGSGKSTMSHLLQKWLAQHLDVHSYYLGSKQPSRRSAQLYLFFRMARRSQRASSRWLGEQSPLARWMAMLRDSLLFSHHLSIGRDRYRRFQSGSNKAIGGSIVIYDRYPLELISSGSEYRLLDGPQIPLNADDQMAVLGRSFARAERKLYRLMRLPDYLFALDVSPDISLQRKPDHNREAVEAKIRVINELTTRDDLDSQQVNLVYINADLPFEEVLSQLKRKIWEVL